MTGVYPEPPARRQEKGETEWRIRKPDFRGRGRGRQHPAVAVSFFVIKKKKKKASPDFESSYGFKKNKIKCKSYQPLLFDDRGHVCPGPHVAYGLPFLRKPCHDGQQRGVGAGARGGGRRGGQGMGRHAGGTRGHAGGGGEAGAQGGTQGYPSPRLLLVSTALRL